MSAQLLFADDASEQCAAWWPGHQDGRYVAMGIWGIGIGAADLGQLLGPAVVRAVEQTVGEAVVAGVTPASFNTAGLQARATASISAKGWQISPPERTKSPRLISSSTLAFDEALVHALVASTDQQRHQGFVANCLDARLGQRAHRPG